MCCLPSLVRERRLRNMMPGIYHDPGEAKQGGRPAHKRFGGCLPCHSKTCAPKNLKTPIPCESRVNYAKFSHDSRLVLTVSRDGTVGLWNTEGRPTTPPLPHGGTLLAVDFSPDDLVLATGATDGTARFWDTATGELISSYRHEAMVNHLFYSADGQSLFSGLYNVLSEDGPLKPYTVEVWKIPQETRALAWLEGLAELASGWRNRSGAELTRLTTGDLKKNWLALRAQHEEAFAVSPERSLDWHLRQGRDAERAADWKLAAMHLQTVLDARPDTGLIDDLAGIRLRLPSGTNAAALFPLRDPTTESRLIDLTRYYNAALTESWQQRHAYLSNDLSSLPAGQQSLAGVAWDIRGIIQVTSQQLRDVSPPWPAKVENISIGQVCQRLHFLHSACFDRSKPLQTIGQYLVRFEDGSEVEVPIVLGKDVLDWVVEPEAHMPAPVVAWVGQNTYSRNRGNRKIRLFKSTWENPRPHVRVTTIDFVSTMKQAAPFLIAITAEP